MPADYWRNHSGDAFQQNKAARTYANPNSGCFDIRKVLLCLIRLPHPAVQKTKLAVDARRIRHIENRFFKTRAS
jgi:hypothetical protein